MDGRCQSTRRNGLFFTVARNSWLALKKSEATCFAAKLFIGANDHNILVCLFGLSPGLINK